MSNNKVFFKGLNELRAIAAFAVVFHHLEIYKNVEGMPSLKDYLFFKSFISFLGHNGVVCFFVLSGFLITYLLIVEKEEYTTIHIKDFYIRRILRIWPLYFLVVLISYLIIPLIIDLPFFDNQQYYPKLVKSLNYYSIFMFIFFISNFALAIFKPVVGASQSWSVSVEEQFYIIWPWLVKKAKSIKILLIAISILFFCKIVLNEFVVYYFDKSFRFQKAFALFQIEYMCVGAIGAICIYANWQQKINKILVSKYTICLLGIILIYELFDKNHHPLILACLFLFFIYVLISSNFKNKYLSYLGKISYGIYMFHPIVMLFTFSLSSHLFANSLLFFNLFYYISTILLTILLSHFSFYNFESYFMKFKAKYTIVKSGD